MKAIEPSDGSFFTAEDVVQIIHLNKRWTFFTRLWLKKSVELWKMQYLIVIDKRSTWGCQVLPKTQTLLYTRWEMLAPGLWGYVVSHHDLSKPDKGWQEMDNEVHTFRIVWWWPMVFHVHRVVNQGINDSNDIKQCWVHGSHRSWIGNIIRCSHELDERRKYNYPELAPKWLR